jgi:hypothetical protein
VCAPPTVGALSPLVLIEIPAVGLHNASADLNTAFGHALMQIMLAHIRNTDERYLNLLRTAGS